MDTGGNTTRQRTNQVLEAVRRGKKVRQVPRRRAHAGGRKKPGRGPVRWENTTRQGEQPGSLAQASPPC